MTQEEKAKAYDEALERAKILYNDKNEIGYANAESVLEEVFPLLKESEDEKIRKEIISFIQDAIDEINLKVSGDYDDRDEDDIAHQNWCKKAIAWLENIPYTIDHEKREGFHLGYKAGLEKQGESYTKRDVDDAYVEGMAFAKYELEKQGEQKPDWSEEDECYMSECIGAIATKEGWSFEEKRKTKHWLKSLKQRIGG